MNEKLSFVTRKEDVCFYLKEKFIGMITEIDGEFSGSIIPKDRSDFDLISSENCKTFSGAVDWFQNKFREIYR